MSYDISVSHRDLLELEGRLRLELRDLSRARAAGAPPPKELLYAARDALHRLRTRSHDVRAAVALLSDPERHLYAEHVAAHGRALAALQAELHAMEPRATAVPTVWDTHEDKEKGKTRKANADEDQGKDEEDEAAVTRRRLVRLQRSTLASLARTERGLGETEAIAGETAALLHAQTEQIEDIHARVGGARAELHQAGQELRVFMRRQMRDRVVVCMSVVILLCLLATVVVSIIRHKW